MKTLAYLALAACALAGPTLSLAQTTNALVTRADVRAELIRLEEAGYSPWVGGDANYPTDIQAAETKVANTEKQAVPAPQQGGDAMGGTPLVTSTGR